ncbi:MAG: hypothetical protein K2M11_01705 [Paramuribaculum sp.]|nr:hypothetical protein [Paramuribaculum sp.]
MTHTNYLSFDLAWYTILCQYSRSVRRTVCDAVLNFAATGEIPVLKGTAKIAFEFISHEISKQRIPNNPSTNNEPTDIQPEAPQQNPVPEEEPIQIPADTPENHPETQTAEDPEIEAPDTDKDTLVQPQTEPASIHPEPIPEAPACIPSPTAHHVKHKNTQRGCISRSRQTVGGVLCVRKGSKMIFKKR